MKRLVCIDYVEHPDLDMTQGIYDLQGGYADRLAGWTNKGGLELEQFAGAQILSIRRLETGVLQLELDTGSTAETPADVEQLKRDHELFQLSILSAAGLPVGTSMADLLSKLMEKRWTLEEIKAAWLRAVDGGPAGTLSAEDFEKDWLRIQKALLGAEQ